ncbi:hypothetical protein CYY_008839 [Polysphondylium violaceum]|uniref:MPN domain-containing protein n=1 Tax=Polysphondylium violaceum TaxID=133409 RepID=A0A8J4PME0_9MYCE|nr:hypothetical protein CYY_008839 [Polysphondylium violaceum]
MSSSISIYFDALCKIHCHALKHPASSINGLLIGSVDKKDQHIIVKDVIPLFHTYTLSPLFEVAMIQIEQYCRINGLDIIGLYNGNQNLSNELDPEPIVKRISDILFSELKTMSLLTVTKIEDDCPSGLVVMDKAGSEHGWIKNKRNVVSIDITADNKNTDIKRTLKDILLQGKESSIVDFEDYTNNPSLDWLNKSWKR